MKFTWSYSNLNSFEQCPKRHWHLKVQKDYKEEEGEHLVYGKQVHKALEDRVSKNTPLPLHLRHLDDICASICNRGAEVSTEVRLALNRDFRPVAFFAPDVWVRAVLDLVLINGSNAVAIDWKTGAKVNDDFTQLELAAAILMHTMEELENVSLGFVFTQVGTTLRSSIARADLTNVWNSILPRVRRMESSFHGSDFPARPCGLCRKYCPVTACPHNGGV